MLNLYDFLNHLLSFGLDLYWRRVLVKSLKLEDSVTVLDVATGTGDVGFAILIKSDVKIIGLDYAFKMTEIGSKKRYRSPRPDCLLRFLSTSSCHPLFGCVGGTLVY